MVSAARGHASPARGKTIKGRAVTSWLAAVAIAAGACALPALAADANDPNRPAFDMSASDVGEKITRLLLDKPEVPITLPLNAEKPVAVSPLPTEGAMVVDRLCRLWSERDSTWLVLTFEPEPGRADEPERRVLPCRLTEQMETLAARTPGTRFRISGETTVYEGHAYLLPAKVTMLPPEAPAPAAAPVKAPAPTTKPTPATTRAADPNTEPSSSDLLDALLAEKVGRPVQAVPVMPDSAKPASVAPTGPSVLPLARREMVADRLVRLVPDPQGRWWLAAFESDNTLQEPPMRLLPCGMLAKAQALAAGARPGRMRVLRVSGKVTRYAGNRYLLLRKVIVELNLGQF